MQNSDMKSRVMSGLAWKFAERISAQLVTFIVTIILARILDPAHYGAIAIVNIFITLANVFVVSGFGNSLIQKKDSDDTDFSSVFYVNIALSLVLYALVFVAAPYIAHFYDMEILSPVLRVMGIRLIIAGINSVQHAYVSKKMLFRRFFWSTLGGTLVSGVVGIIMAYKGYGIWALAAQYMVNTTVDTVVLFITVKWYPKLSFSIKRLKSLFSYGWKLLMSELLETGYNELRSLLIGKMYTSEDLAYYNKGKSFPALVVTNINSSINSVLFPAMAQCQDKKEVVKSMCRRAIRTSSYIMFPFMVGLALVAEPFVKLLLTDKWLPCVPFLRIACFSIILRPVHTANLQAIKAMGRSDIFLKLEIIKKVLGLTLLICVARFGVLAICISALVVAILNSFINAFPNKKLINYSYIEQMKDLTSSFLPLIAMSVSVYIVGMFLHPPLLQITAQMLVGAFVYILISAITKNETFNYIFSVVKGFLKK